jgi:hypothetical protein
MNDLVARSCPGIAAAYRGACTAAGRRWLVWQARPPPPRVRPRESVPRLPQRRGVAVAPPAPRLPQGERRTSRLVRGRSRESAPGSLCAAACAECALRAAHVHTLCAAACAVGQRPPPLPPCGFAGASPRVEYV